MGRSGPPAPTWGGCRTRIPCHATAQVHEFRAAPAGVALAANTSYYVVVAGVNGAVKRTTNYGEDGAWGWSLANAYHAQASSSWSTADRRLEAGAPGDLHNGAAGRAEGLRASRWWPHRAGIAPGTPDDTVAVTVTFSEKVTVDDTGGTPTLKLQLGFDDDRSATYLSGSETDAARCSATRSPLPTARI